VDSPLPGQSECQELLKLYPSECTYGLDCEADYLSTKCSLASEGAIDCTCSSASSGEFHVYTVLPGADLETACRSSISLCNGENAPEATETECHDLTLVESSYCTQSRDCTLTVDLGEGITAVETTSEYGADCNSEGVDRSGCYCPAFSYGLTVHGVSVIDACAAVVPLCQGEVQYGDEAACAEPELSVYGGSCSSRRSCGTRTNLNEAGDVYATEHSFWRESFCSAIDEESSECYCPSEYGVYRSAVLETSTLDACVTMDEVCHSGVPLEASAGLECDEPAAQAQAEQCTASSYCTQELTSGSVPVSGGAGLASRCETNSNGAWVCTCDGGWEQSTPTVLNAPNALRACLDALDDCALRGRIETDPSGIVALRFSELAQSIDAGAPVAIDASVSSGL
jgi:hypothetical protein